MNKISVKGVLSEIISLAKHTGVQDNTATTKLLTAKPSRHSLAIFVPILSTGAMLSYSDFTVYGGLIEPNIIPFLGNKFSRLVAVVETCHPIYRVVSLTKLLGAFQC